MEWNELSVDGEQPKGDLLRVEVKLDRVIAMLNSIKGILTAQTGDSFIEEHPLPF